MLKKIALGSALLLTLGIFQESKAGGEKLCPKLTIENVKSFLGRMKTQEYTNSEGTPVAFGIAKVKVLGADYDFIMPQGPKFAIPEEIIDIGGMNGGDSKPSDPENLKTLKFPEELSKNHYCSYTFTGGNKGVDIYSAEIYSFFLVKK